MSGAKLQNQFEDLGPRWKYSISVPPPTFLNIMLDKVSLCLREKTYSFIGWGAIIWDREDKFSKFIDREVTRALGQGVHTRDVSILPVSVNFFGTCACFVRHNSGTSMLIWREGTLWQFSLKCGFSSIALTEWRESENHMTL